MVVSDPSQSGDAVVKVLCCGSRTFRARGVVKHRLSELPAGTMVIHGDAAGADTLSDFAAREHGFSVRSYPARWDLEGRGAGPRRNARMIAEEHPDREGVCLDQCLAFTDDLANSKGTRDMVTRAVKANIPVEVVGSDGGRRVLSGDWIP